jgi:hypothetical protein
MDQATFFVNELEAAKPSTFLDIGAHVGTHTLYAAAVGYHGICIHAY